MVIIMDSTINVRNVDEAVYRKFRGKCAELNMPTGKAITEALEMWLEKYGIKVEKPKAKITA